MKPQDNNQIKDFFDKLHSKTEDILFPVISKIPDSLMPSFILKWLDQYADKRIQELRLQVTRQRWKENSLERTLDDIHSVKQDTQKAPSND